MSEEDTDLIVLQGDIEELRGQLLMLSLIVGRLVVRSLSEKELSAFIAALKPLLLGRLELGGHFSEGFRKALEELLRVCGLLLPDDGHHSFAELLERLKNDHDAGNSAAAPPD